MQDKYLKSDKESAIYWDDYLLGFETKTALPLDNKKKSRISSLEKYTFSFPDDSGTLEAFTTKYCIEANILIYTAWGILLQRYNNTDDIIFGIRLSGDEELIPLRIKTETDVLLINMIRSISSDLEDKKLYGRIPSDSIEKLKLDNILSSIVTPFEIQKNNQIDLKYDSNELSLNFDGVDIVLSFLFDKSIELGFYFEHGRFKQETVTRMSVHLINLIKDIIENPVKSLSQLELMSQDEKKKILVEFNNTDVEYDENITIHELIRKQAEKTPDYTAVSFENQKITYKELNCESDRIAGMLKKRGVKKGDIIGIFLPRSAEMIACILGILKSGGVCLPLDIGHPETRTNMILKDSGANVLLADEGHACPAGFEGSIVRIGSIPCEDYEKCISDDLAYSDSPAYMIYTSGSTGKPKGVILSHRGIINHVMTKIKVLDITNKDIVCNNFSINVVASIWQIFAPLFVSAKLIVYSEEIERDPYEQFIKASEDGISVIEVIPSVLNAYIDLLEKGKPSIYLKNIRTIALTSEETKTSLVNKFYKFYNSILVNCYGQTECSDDTLHYKIPFNTRTEIVYIGKPSNNTQAYILDHKNRLQPVGIAGELCISGDGVAKGYWNRGELTAQKFEQNPFLPGRTMYRTGDLARWMSDGNIEYLGRIDYQVKIRGNRIELGEIENVLSKSGVIKEVAVIAREDEKENRYLSAYFTSDEILTVLDLRDYLSKELPDYMIPAYFIQLDKMPLTPNGKIDRKILPIQVGNIETGVDYVKPEGELEEKILNIWKQVIEVEKIGANDSFFELGGNSITAVHMLAEISDLFPGKIFMQDIFEYPTISKIAGLIKKRIALSNS